MLQEAQVQIGANVVTYNVANSACEKGRHLQKAVALHAEMEARGLAPDEITYNDAISACEKRGQWERAAALLAQMEGRGLAPNEITHQRVREGGATVLFEVPIPRVHPLEMHIREEPVSWRCDSGRSL